MESRIEALVAQMTLEEKLSMLAGSSMWRPAGIERLGVPVMKLTDGPSGARGESFGEVAAACFPCGTSLAASWDPELVLSIGRALGEEARSKGAHVLLGPTVNMHRSPLAGRNFECFSEDPHLASAMAVSYVRGVQSTGVGTSVKHFVANDSEFERRTISSEVGERPLREIYLRPFEAAVREAGAWTVMGAYNRINGVYACEHQRLLTEILKGEWGFDGVVVSDWYATHDGVASARGGLDLEMPGPPRHFGEELLRAAQEGHVDEALLDDKVRRILRLALRTGAFEQAEVGPELAIDDPRHRSLIRRAGADGMVLLKNDRQTLPFAPGSISTLAVVGPNAVSASIQGGGSARVVPHSAVTPLEGIRARAGTEVRVVYEPGCTAHRYAPLIDPDWITLSATDGRRGLLAEFFNGPEAIGRPVFARAVRHSEMVFMDAIGPGVAAQDFTARLTGILQVPESGRYVFGLLSAGPSRLALDGGTLIHGPVATGDDLGPFSGAQGEVTAEVDLQAGAQYQLEVVYRKAGPRFGGLRLGCLAPQPDDLIDRAVAAAAACDAAVVVVGLNREWESEGRDRSDMDLPGRQDELIERVAAANPATVVVVNAGSPVLMGWADSVPPYSKPGIRDRNSATPSPMCSSVMSTLREGFRPRFPCGSRTIPPTPTTRGRTVGLSMEKVSWWATATTTRTE